jgi:hypothetical protein
MKPDKRQLTKILEAVRVSLKKRASPVFQDKAKQDEFLKHVEIGLSIYASKGWADRSRSATKFKIIKKHLDGLKDSFDGLDPFERVTIDIAAEQAFKMILAGTDAAALHNLSPSRYGRTDGISMLARLKGDGFNTAFIFDQFQLDCMLLAKAMKPVVASRSEAPSTKKYHLEPNVELFIIFLGRMWKEVFNETPSWNPGGAFGMVMNGLLDEFSLKVGARTLKRILCL